VSGLRLLSKLLWRCAELVFFLGPAVSWYILQKVPFIGCCFSRHRLLSLLIGSLARCGPVGIKWGQWASTRYDLFEDDFCEALGTLTNRAPAHSFACTRETVEASFGQPMDALFESFEESPLASGSIGQVHLAKLRHAQQNETVAVKVQHPNLTERLALDMTILRRLAALAAHLAPDMRIGETADQFALNFEAQLDFRDEALNLDKFAANFSSSFWSAVVSFPRPIRGLVSHDVLVETYEEGESVATFLTRSGTREVGEWKQDKKGQWYMVQKGDEGKKRYAGTANVGDLRSNIALCGVQAYLKMLIWDNYIHADLHPGNVLIRVERIRPWARLQRWLVMGNPSATVPHIVLLDAGLAASFNQRIFSSSKSFFDAVVRMDGPAIGNAILGLAESQPFVDGTPGAREAFVAEVAAKCEAQQAEFHRGEGRPGDNIRAYMDSVRKFRVVLDPTVMVALMSMMVLEGWQYRLDPATSVFHCIESATGHGMFGIMQRAHDNYRSVVNRLTGQGA